MSRVHFHGSQVCEPGVVPARRRPPRARYRSDHHLAVDRLDENLATSPTGGGDEASVLGGGPLVRLARRLEEGGEVKGYK